MTQISLAQQTMVQLVDEEAEALYSTKINVNCPFKYYDAGKKVWWVINGPNGSFPFTICQECYHTGRFGDKDISIKKDLKPMILVNMPCNCDGRKLFDGYPISFGNGWFCGLYSVTPYISMLKTDYNYDKDKMCIDISFPFQTAKYAICLYSDNIIYPENIICEIAEEHVTHKTVLTPNPNQEGGHNMTIHNNNNENNSFNFVFDNTLPLNKFTVKIYDTTEDLTDELNSITDDFAIPEYSELASPNGEEAVKKQLIKPIIVKGKKIKKPIKKLPDITAAAEKLLLEKVLEDGNSEKYVTISEHYQHFDPLPTPLTFSSLGLSSSSLYSGFGSSLLHPSGLTTLPKISIETRRKTNHKINKKLLFEFDITPRHIDDPAPVNTAEPEYTEQTIII
ncbi:MAG: hypothetical protein Hyperionvirus15_29 [Hyperionvirus sp.]|uniref:Uncharacterized protein n=1 Tax=Hyperionvirus sp. TaxID=2487770 RepID=A0A3G5ACK5_9VIRU|nr:MAG: hypothetical protein Hyperionvirus15_29 [Hyperionvirus sp.]